MNEASPPPPSWPPLRRRLAQENSLNRAGSGARAAGMGNAFIAVSDDGTAASWNPAGLSQLRKPELSLVHTTSRRNLFLEGYRARDQSAAYTTLRTPSTTGDIEFASAAVPFSVAGRSVTLQAGWRRLYQLSARTRGDMRRIPASEDARPESLIQLDNTTDGNVDLWSVAGAIRLTSRLSVGWSTDFYRGGWEDRGNASDDPGVLGPTDFSSFRNSNRIGGHNLTLGLLLAYPSVRVGVVYHGSLRSDYEVSQSVRSSLTAPFELRSGPEDRVALLFPRSLGLGRRLASQAPAAAGPRLHLRRVDEVPGRGDARVPGSTGERLRRPPARAQRDSQYRHRERGAGEALSRHG